MIPEPHDRAMAEYPEHFEDGPEADYETIYQYERSSGETVAFLYEWPDVVVEIDGDQKPAHELQDYLRKPGESRRDAAVRWAKNWELEDQEPTERQLERMNADEPRGSDLLNDRMREARQYK